MKLHLNSSAGRNAISGHGPGFVLINQLRIDHPVIVMPDKLIDPWPAPDFSELAFADFANLIDLNLELVIFGAGREFRFPDTRIMAAFSRARIGFEAMDTPAACRTYNVLMNEGRNVAAALLL